MNLPEQMRKVQSIKPLAPSHTAHLRQSWELAPGLCGTWACDLSAAVLLSVHHLFVS